ncbi:hypothetical protein O181_080678 [Austropuccinia psidii MF-1]|uniref:Uncharacterized protein n=1 Tax=Austropuccinia psidii MF-1 TaxID=1389203 RepID=A0A9Q3FJ39_9BASI|nr:hypothetical protein [Austropuccinia psidii MF-1]
MSPVHHRDLGIPRNKPEEREGLSRTRRHGSRHLGHSGRWQDIEEVHTPGGEGNHDKGESSHYPSYRTAEPDGASSDSFRLTRTKLNQLSGAITPFRHQQISDQESPLFIIPCSFQEKTRIQGQKQDLFQPKAERVRPNDTEAF